jgi:hypothetical protein
VGGKTVGLDMAPLAHLPSELRCKVAYGGGGYRAGAIKFLRRPELPKIYYGVCYGAEEKRQKKDLGD